MSKLVILAPITWIKSMSTPDYKSSSVVIPHTGYTRTPAGAIYSTHTENAMYSTIGSVSGLNNSPPPYTSGSLVNIHKSNKQKGILNGHWIAGHTYDNYPKFTYNDNFQEPIYSDISITKHIARTNPSAPVIDLGVVVGELRELPKLMFQVGRGVIKDTANGYLQYQFGVKPLVQDLLSALDFAEHANKRATLLHRLYQDGGLKFRSKPKEVYYKSETDYAGYDRQFIVHYNKSVTVEQWTHVSWLLDHDPPDSLRYGYDKRRALAMRTAYFGSPDLSTLWELLPWSWMIDYFADVGSYLSSRRNTVGATAGHAYRMTHTEKFSHTSIVPKFSDAWASQEPQSVVTTKNRSASEFASVEANFGFIQARQAANILAVIAQRS